MQNDIIGIVDSSNALVVKYYYDAYGRIIKTLDTSGINLSNINPFRYRSYYQDYETGWYFLNSRYYNPLTNRFITMDEIEYLGASGSVLSYNLYSYCENNPIIRIDSEGDAWWIIIPVAIIVLGLTGCSSSSFGAARAYKSVKGGPNTPNCYAYAIGLNRAINPGNLSGKNPKFNDVDAVASAVISDLKAIGRSARKISGVNASIKSNEYRIALRCGKKPYANDIYGRPLYDYHFMVQHNDGRWSEKHGTRGNSILHASGKNPNNISWDLGNLINYYNSKIIYLAITT